MEYLKVRILSPKEVLFEGEALSVSSRNVSGKFDILPEHANFMTLVENSPLIIQKSDQQRVTFNLTLALIYTSKDQVNIYTDILISIN
ncbi:hypothetical protein HY386_02305 [Candidatus Daviesbacteria bacterium]|nr:hypothetical protein [Candidatus Daviesbacteria bacterium]